MRKTNLLALLVAFLQAATLFAQNTSTTTQESNRETASCIFPANDQALETYFISVGEYVNFLNAIAETDDVHHLYSDIIGKQITSFSMPGHSIYTPIDNNEQDVLIGLTRLEAIRYCNWLENGSLLEINAGEKAVDSTEHGSYKLKDDQVVSINSQSTYHLVDTDENATSFEITTTPPLEQSSSPLMMFPREGEKKTSDTAASGPQARNRTGDSSSSASMARGTPVRGIAESSSAAAPTSTSNQRSRSLTLQDFRIALAANPNATRFVIGENNWIQVRGSAGDTREENLTIINALRDALEREVSSASRGIVDQVIEPFNLLTHNNSHLSAARLSQVFDRAKPAIIEATARAAASSANETSSTTTWRDEMDSKNFAAPQNKAVFWTGRFDGNNITLCNSARAKAYVEARDKTMLETTEGGLWLESHKLYETHETPLSQSKEPSFYLQSEADRLWAYASEQFVKQAAGHVVAFVLQPEDIRFGSESIYNRLEKPYLMKNPNVFLSENRLMRSDPIILTEKQNRKLEEHQSEITTILHRLNDAQRLWRTIHDNKINKFTSSNCEVFLNDPIKNQIIDDSTRALRKLAQEKDLLSYPRQARTMIESWNSIYTAVEMLHTNFIEEAQEHATLARTNLTKTEALGKIDQWKSHYEWMNEAIQTIDDHIYNAYRKQGNEEAASLWKHSRGYADEEEIHTEPLSISSRTADILNYQFPFSPSDAAALPISPGFITLNKQGIQSADRAFTLQRTGRFTYYYTEANKTLQIEAEPGISNMAFRIPEEARWFEPHHSNIITSAERERIRKNIDHALKAMEAAGNPEHVVFASPASAASDETLAVAQAVPFSKTGWKTFTGVPAIPSDASRPDPISLPPPPARKENAITAALPPPRNPESQQAVTSRTAEVTAAREALARLEVQRREAYAARDAAKVELDRADAEVQKLSKAAYETQDTLNRELSAYQNKPRPRVNTPKKNRAYQAGYKQIENRIRPIIENRIRPIIMAAHQRTNEPNKIRLALRPKYNELVAAANTIDTQMTTATANLRQAEEALAEMTSSSLSLTTPPLKSAATPASNNTNIKEAATSAPTTSASSAVRTSSTASSAPPRNPESQQAVSSRTAEVTSAREALARLEAQRLEAYAARDAAKVELDRAAGEYQTLRKAVDTTRASCATEWNANKNIQKKPALNQMSIRHNTGIATADKKATDANKARLDLETKYNELVAAANTIATQITTATTNLRQAETALAEMTSSSSSGAIAIAAPSIPKKTESQPANVTRPLTSLTPSKSTLDDLNSTHTSGIPTNVIKTKKFHVFDIADFPSASSTQVPKAATQPKNSTSSSTVAQTVAPENITPSLSQTRWVAYAAGKGWNTVSEEDSRTVASASSAFSNSIGPSLSQTRREAYAGCNTVREEDSRMVASAKNLKKEQDKSCVIN